MIQAHAYWRNKALAVDLVILSEAYAGYRLSLLDAIIGLINVGPEAKPATSPPASSCGTWPRCPKTMPSSSRPSAASS